MQLYSFDNKKEESPKKKKTQRRAQSFSQGEIKIGCDVFSYILTGRDAGSLMTRDEARSLYSKFLRMRDSEKKEPIGGA